MDQTLNEARQKLKEQDEVLGKILDSATDLGVVIDSYKLEKKGEEVSHYLVLLQGSLVNITSDPRLKIKIGDTVSVFRQEDILTIVDILPSSITTGEIGKVIEQMASGKVLVEIKGEKKFVYPGLFRDLVQGEEIVVYEDLLITEKFKSSQVGVNNSKPATVSWDDIGGLKEVKEQMKEIIEKPIQYKSLYEAYGQSLPKGVLLFGLPGMGKTMIGKAVATSLSKNKKTDEDGFFYVKGPELLSKWVGQAEESIRKLFKDATDFYDRNQVPAVIFIDEAEAILGRRGSGQSSDVEKTIVPQFLVEMDGIKDTQGKFVVILATNRPEMLDSAIIREGRIDKKIRVGSPDREAAGSIISINLKKAVLADTLEEIREAFLSLLFDSSGDQLHLYTLTLSSGLEVKLHLKDILSGAMLTNMVQTAISFAIRRDIENESEIATGVTKEDVRLAIESLYSQHRSIQHREHIEDFQAELDGLKIQNIKKTK